MKKKELKIKMMPWDTYPGLFMRFDKLEALHIENDKNLNLSTLKSECSKQNRYARLRGEIEDWEMKYQFRSDLKVGYISIVKVENSKVKA